MPRTSRPAVGRRARPAASDARGQLLDAAIAQFAQRGVANTTVAQIAAAAQVTSAMVHYWFDTRERLLEAIVEERLAPLFHYVWGVDIGQHAPLEVAQELVRRLFEVTARMPSLPSLWVREVVNEGGLLREYALRRIPLQQVTAFAEAMAGGKQRGEVNADIEPWLVFNSILGLVMLPQAAAKIWNRINPTLKLDRAGLERHVTALLMHGLAKGQAAARRPHRKARSV